MFSCVASYPIGAARWKNLMTGTNQGKIYDRYRGVHPDSFDHKLADPPPGGKGCHVPVLVDAGGWW